MLRNVEMNGDASLVAFALGRSVQLLVLLQRWLVAVPVVTQRAAVQLLSSVHQLVSLQGSSAAEALAALTTGVPLLSAVSQLVQLQAAGHREALAAVCAAVGLLSGVACGGGCAGARPDCSSWCRAGSGRASLRCGRGDASSGRRRLWSSSRTERRRRASRRCALGSGCAGCRHWRRFSADGAGVWPFSSGVRAQGVCAAGPGDRSSCCTYRRRRASRRCALGCDCAGCRRWQRF